VKRYSEAFGLWPGDLNIPETAGPHSPDKRWRDVPQFSSLVRAQSPRGCALSRAQAVSLSSFPNQGPFVIVSVIARPRHGIRYRVRSQDDETIEHVVDESELSTT
jgi:hypothetical protein